MQWALAALAILAASCAPAGPTLTPEATLVVSAPSDEAYWGPAVALSADGTRALLGARWHVVDGAQTGCARVFVRDADGWSEEALLLPAGAAAGDNIGHTVALSADGTRALVGAHRRDAGGANHGAVFVFVRTGSSWAEEVTLSPTEARPESFFTSGVGISADGSRVAVAAPENGVVGGPGRVHVFARTGTSWSLEAVVFSSTGAPDFGSSLALAGDGDRMLVGTEYEGDVGGSARVFVRSGTTWTEEQNLAPLGDSVTLSADGSRALVYGERTDDGYNTHETRAFVREGSVWTEEAPQLWPRRALAISADGTHALLSRDLFFHGDAGWTFEVSLLPSSPDGGGAGVLSGDGSVALVSGPGLADVYHLSTEP